MTDEQRKKIEDACKLHFENAFDQLALKAFSATSSTSTLASESVLTLDTLNQAINRVRVMQRELNVVFVVEFPHDGPILQVKNADGTRYEMSWQQANELHKHWPMRLHKVISPDVAEFVPVSGVFPEPVPLVLPMPPFEIPDDKS